MTNRVSGRDAGEEGASRPDVGLAVRGGPGSRPIERRSVWRKGADDPQSALGWAARQLPRVARAAGARALNGFRLVAVVAAVEGEVALAALALALTFLPGLLARSSGAFRWIVGAPSAPRPRLRVESLLTLPPPAPPYPCRIELRRDGLLQGEDVGIVSFLDGWLCFEGHRTDFALSKRDVSLSKTDRLRFADGSELVFRPDDALAVEDGLETRLVERFKHALAQWGFRPGGPGHDLPGASVLPPAGLHSSGLAPALADLASEAILLVPSLLFVRVLAWSRPEGWIPLLAALPVFALLRAIWTVARLLGRKRAVE